MTSQKKFPVVEIFGPTVQGEGIEQGLPVYFLRMGGCDFRCNWCDTPHAVLPQSVRAARRMTEDEICDALVSLPQGPRTVVLSGGNPCLHELGGVLDKLYEADLRVSLETQGSLWKEWVLGCDTVCISPKPPSSLMVTDWGKLDFFLAQRSFSNAANWFLKVVVFDINDYEYAREVHQRYPIVPFFLSAGNDAGKTVGNPSREDTRDLTQVRTGLLSKYLWLINRTMVDPDMSDVRVQCQSHVLAWGNKLGV